MFYPPSSIGILREHMGRDCSFEKLPLPLLLSIIRYFGRASGDSTWRDEKGKTCFRIPINLRILTSVGYYPLIHPVQYLSGAFSLCLQLSVLFPPRRVCLFHFPMLCLIWLVCCASIFLCCTSCYGEEWPCSMVVIRCFQLFH